MATALQMKPCGPRICKTTDMSLSTLEQFAAGDLVAFETLFREFQSPVYGWIMRIVRDRAAAEDLTVETFWRAWNARARFDPHRSFGAWARRIASNVALNHLKRNRVLAGFRRPPEGRPAEAARST